MHIGEKTKSLATDAGCDFYGVADLSSIQPSVVEQGGSLVGGYPFAVSVGIAMPNAIVDQLPNRANAAVATAYRHHSYHVLNLRLDLVTAQIAGLLQREGYKAFPVPASERYDSERLCAVFSHKLAAHLAGLGWIGKSCLLVTPEAGPRVRWGSVLTDAPLQSTGEPMPEKCGACTECVDICPVQAFTGQPFHEDESRDVRYDAHTCEEYQDVTDSAITPRVCGLCVYVCPYGRKV